MLKEDDFIITKPRKTIRLAVWTSEFTILISPKHFVCIKDVEDYIADIISLQQLDNF